MKVKTDLVEYYSQRANEFENAYKIPERQEDLIRLRELLQQLLGGHDIFEVACGTGYWTEAISQTAKSILATDASQEMLELAKKKFYSPAQVSFEPVDAYSLDKISGKFTAGFAGFWWSHMPKMQIPDFLYHFHKVLSPGALVVMTDTLLDQKSRSSISRHDDDGNIYQLRQLENGDWYEVLKNFPDEEEIKAFLAGHAYDIVFTRMQYYWCLMYFTI